MVEKSYNVTRATSSISRAINRAAAPRAGRRRCQRGSCRHCGAVLHEDEREEECSSALNVDVRTLRWQAAQVLRGSELL